MAKTKTKKMIGQPAKDEDQIRVSLQIRVWQLKKLLQRGRHWESGHAATIVKRVLYETFPELAPPKFVKMLQEDWNKTGVMINSKGHVLLEVDPKNGHSIVGTGISRPEKPRKTPIKTL